MSTYSAQQLQYMQCCGFERTITSYLHYLTYLKYVFQSTALHDGYTIEDGTLDDTSGV
jgi:hypothetical protein